MNTPRIVFLFTSPRDELIARVRAGTDADTALHGLNHIPGAEYIVAFPKSLSSLLSVPRLLTYDFVIAQDNFLLGFVVSVCARLFRRKTKWLYTAIHSSTLMRRHAAHPVRLFLLKMFWNSYARIICISLEQMEDFVRLGLERERLVFLPIGVDADFFRHTAVPEEYLIVSVGRDMGRDYATLFSAVARIGHPCIVVAAPKNISPDLKIPANVSVLYDKSLADIRDLYTRARLVVIASKDASVPDGSDCSGQTVILDALAAGKAVIATHRAWIADYLTPDEDITVVAPDDPEALACAIEEVSNDSLERGRLAASGHTKVIERYTTKAFADALLALMNSLV